MDSDVTQSIHGIHSCRCALHCLAASSGAQASSCRLHNLRGHFVGVAVRGGPPVFHVPFAIGLSLAGNADGSAAVGHAILECVNVTSFVLPGETLVVTLAIPH